MILNYLWNWCMTGQNLASVCLVGFFSKENPKQLCNACFEAVMPPQYKMCSWLEDNFLIKIIILEQKTFQGLNCMTEDAQVDLLAPCPPPHQFYLLYSACVMPVTLSKIQLKIPKEVEKSSPESTVSFGTLEHKWLLSPWQCFTEALE